jgi:hypothetical protein
MVNKMDDDRFVVDDCCVKVARIEIVLRGSHLAHPHHTHVIPEVQSAASSVSFDHERPNHLDDSLAGSLSTIQTKAWSGRVRKFQAT